MNTSIDELRSKHRKRRRELSADVLFENAERLAARVIELPMYKSAVHIAAYKAILGEISIEPVFRGGSNEGKTFYLPVLRDNAMFFAPWLPDDPLIKKDFGLLEPTCAESEWIKPDTLDLVLTPLVVFDQNCNRIGQGGGYYDRTFEFTRKSDKPVLLGVAHDSQREAALDPQPWDIPLDAVVTEHQIYRSGPDSI